MNSLADWQERVIAERNSLEDNLRKLKTFLNSEQGIQLPSEVKVLMTQQQDIMAEYLSILGQRIALF